MKPFFIGLIQKIYAQIMVRIYLYWIKIDVTLKRTDYFSLGYSFLLSTQWWCPDR
jgi:hypothetical protein